VHEGVTAAADTEPDNFRPDGSARPSPCPAARRGLPAAGTYAAPCLGGV